MKTILISIFAVLVPMLVLDGLWLSTMLKTFYSPRLAHLTAETPNYVPAVLFYLMYAFALVVLVILPAIQGNFSFTKIFLYGGLLGLISYATYDLTNQATLKDWPVIVSVVDMIWGSVLSGLTSVIALYVTKMFS